jgi:hypothetical protein
LDDILQFGSIHADSVGIKGENKSGIEKRVSNKIQKVPRLAELPKQPTTPLTFPHQTPLFNGDSQPVVSLS